MSILKLSKNRKLWYSFYLSLVFLYILFIAIFIQGLPEKLAAVSIGIAVISMFLVFMSDTLINTILNSEFRRIIGNIEDLRLELEEFHDVMNPNTGKVTPQQKIYTKSQINTWKCQTYVDAAVAIILKSDVKPNNISRFLNLINNYIAVIFNVRNQFNVEIVINIISIYNRFYSLEASLSRKTLKQSNFEARKDASIPLIRTLTGVGTNVTIDLDFLKQYNVILKKLINEDTTLQEREDIRWNLFFSHVRDSLISNI